MPFDFPDAPTINDEVTAPGGAVYNWNGTRWVAAGQSTAYMPLAGDSTKDGTLTVTGALTATDDVVVGAPPDGAQGPGSLIQSGRHIINLNPAALDATTESYAIRIGGTDGQDRHVMLDTFGGCATYLVRRANGTNTAKTPLNDGELISGISGSGWNGSAYAIAAAINIATDGVWGAGASGGYIQFFTTPRGTSTVTLVAQLHYGLFLGAPTGGDMGAGTINVMAGYYVNGTQLAVPLDRISALDLDTEKTPPVMAVTDGLETGETGLALLVRPNGRLEYRRILIDGPDSAGKGYRALRVAN